MYFGKREIVLVMVGKTVQKHDPQLPQVFPRTVTRAAFGYKRNGFASFATKRRIITYLNQFILFSLGRSHLSG